MMPYPACSGLEDALEIHGEWQLRGIRNVVVTTLSGSRNEEAMVAYVEEYKPLTEDLGRYGTLAEPLTDRNPSHGPSEAQSAPTYIGWKGA